MVERTLGYVLFKRRICNDSIRPCNGGVKDVFNVGTDETAINNVSTVGWAQTFKDRRDSPVTTEGFPELINLPEMVSLRYYKGHGYIGWSGVEVQVTTYVLLG
jgi:hypothetical protein